jgi:hypothetical protein
MCSRGVHDKERKKKSTEKPDAEEQETLHSSKLQPQWKAEEHEDQLQLTDAPTYSACFETPPAPQISISFCTTRQHTQHGSNTEHNIA